MFRFQSVPRILGLACVLVAAHGSVQAARRTPCPDGRFVQATALLPGAGAAFDAVVLANGQVSIESGCGTTRARVKALANGSTRVRAAWKSCATRKRVRLVATIGDDGVACHRLVGRLRARRMPTQPIAATRSGCGDELVDPAIGETCDPPGGSCSAQCVATTSPGQPIDVPARTWTWVPFADSACANGTPTGIGVNPGTPGGRLLIFLNGGGACWDETTCYTLATASYVTSGYGAAQFAGDVSGLLSTSFFARDDPSNPFRDDSFVFVPYCTGDVHAGSNANAMHGSHPTRHVGFQNMAAFLERIVPTFSGASRVILSGSSAGGFGALANWWQTQQAFGALRVDLLDDSGPSLPAPYLQESLEQTWRSVWNLAAAAPPGCTACATDLDAVVAFYGAHMTGHRAALLSYTQDSVIGLFYQLSGPQVEAGLRALLAEMAPYDPWRHFVVGGSIHTMLGTPDVTQNGVSLRAWVTQMVTDDPGWASVTPP